MVNPPFESKQAMKSFILESVEEITALLRAISHPKRFLLLGLLLDEPQSDLNTLVEKTGLQKSALGNHLGILIEKNLVEKLDRGVYRLTITGEELLQATTQSFLET
ncbi:MAG: ArsR family transcriptional regulator, partial [Candidatus Hodarchaeales archaeon]